MYKVRKIVILVLICTLMLTGCHDKTGTKYEFSFQTTENEKTYYAEETIYVDENQDKVRLNASLDMKGGEVSVQIIAVEDGTLIWDSIYNQNCDFTIDLQEVQADSEYIIKVQAKDAQKVNLVMLSTDNLVKEKEKPGK